MSSRSGNADDVEVAACEVEPTKQLLERRVTTCYSHAPLRVADLDNDSIACEQL